MEALNDSIQEYKRQLNKGKIQKAYRGIMTFMSGLKTDLKKDNPDFIVSSLYSGYLDMSYFAFTPSDLKMKKLKIAIVFLHKKGKFEAWLSGSNRRIQADYLGKIKDKSLLNQYQLSKGLPGTDSIVESILVEDPDFDHPDELKLQIRKKIIKFIHDVYLIINNENHE